MTKNAPSWPSIQAGSLRHRVQIQSPNAGNPDSFGQADASWLVVRECWASIELIGLREAALPDLLVSQVTHTIMVRWSPVVLAPGMRVVHGSHIYKLQAVENIEQRNILLRLLTLEIDPTS